MQQVLSNRILPAFKRFSIGTEPVREAAKVYMRMYIRDIPRLTIFRPSSGHPFMSKLPRFAYRPPMTYPPCKRLHPVWPWRNPTRLLALKICQPHRGSMPIRSTQIAHRLKLPSSPHRPQSPPRQRQRLRGHGVRMIHLSRHCRQALIRLGACHLSLLSRVLTVSYVSLAAQIHSQRRPLLPRIYSPRRNLRLATLP